jgi:hypothetical protein
LWRSFVHPSVLQVSTGRWMFESQVLMKRGLRMLFFGRTFFASRISQWTPPHDVHPTDHDMRQRQLPELVLSHGEKRARQDTGMSS